MSPDGYEREDRPCKGCKHSKEDLHGWLCTKHLMGITPEMHVTYKKEEGTCYEQDEEENS